MTQNITLEMNVINRFLMKSKRDHHLQFVASSKNRKKFIADIHNGQFFLNGILERVSGIEE